MPDHFFNVAELKRQSASCRNRYARSFLRDKLV